MGESFQSVFCLFACFVASANNDDSNIVCCFFSCTASWTVSRFHRSATNCHFNISPFFGFLRSDGISNTEKKQQIFAKCNDCHCYNGFVFLSDIQIWRYWNHRNEGLYETRGREGVRREKVCVHCRYGSDGDNDDDDDDVDDAALPFRNSQLIAHLKCVAACLKAHSITIRWVHYYDCILGNFAMFLFLFQCDMHIEYIWYILRCAYCLSMKSNKSLDRFTNWFEWQIQEQSAAREEKSSSQLTPNCCAISHFFPPSLRNAQSNEQIVNMENKCTHKYM